MNIEKFQTPPQDYREIPFWSWNDELDPQELVRQIALMDEAGWGGFFMHSRTGLTTPYMGRQWMDCIRACIEAARKHRLSAWLYDEDKWPSGFAGGLSVAANPAYRDQCLVCKVDNKPALLAERIATFSARQIEGQLLDIRPDDAPALGDDAERVIQFYPQTMPLGQPWFNEYAYLDVLNPAAVRAFLDSTHEVYARALGADFGSIVPGIFTDEPQLRAARGRPAVPWTNDFLAYFQSQNGYALLPHLPSLFFDTGEFHRVRYDYWRTVTRRFVESYSKPIYEWCDAHKLAYTGHYNAEDTLYSQIEAVGTAMMPHYVYMHIPGIDKLDRVINEEQAMVLTVKQLDSVVCQTGKPRALCEIYGCCGQDFAHTGRKWIGDWAYVLGINLSTPHLSSYSMRGERKRDYPQVLFYQQPWWPDNRLIADYIARLSYALSQGQRVVDILVIHPIGSAWALYRPGVARDVRQLDRALDELLMTLMQSQRDFHLGDEMLMEPGAATEGGVMVDELGPCLEVGKMAYRVVIVPPGVTLARNTVRLLGEFAQKGGPVLAMEPVPALIDGQDADVPVLPHTVRAVTPGTLPGALDALLPFDVRVPGRPSIWAHHRQTDDGDVYFLANTDLDRGGVATVQVRGTGSMEVWDLTTGQASPLPSQQRGDITELTLDFPPVGSHLLVRKKQLGPSPGAVEPAVERVVSEIHLGDTWELILGGPNALTLDTPQAQIGTGEWSEPVHVLDAHAAIAEAGVGTPFALRFSFEAAVRPAAPVYLVVESPERFAITVNDQPVANAGAGWWTDIAFRKVDVSAAVQAGHNEIVLSGTFGRDTELESVYVIGQFGVAGRRIKEERRFNGQIFDRYAPDFRLTELPACVQARRDAEGLALDLTSQGLAFFAGRATLRQQVTLPPGGRVMLEMHSLRAALAHVCVNGQAQGTAAWPPHCVDITDGVRAGENVIEIELVGTLRNLLGPHHRAGGDMHRTAPKDFRDKSGWTNDVILVPFGFDGVTLRILR